MRGRQTVFFPLARGIPRNSYYLTRLALLSLALSGIAAPGILPPSLVGLATAVVLWATIADLFHRERRRGAHVLTMVLADYYNRKEPTLMFACSRGERDK